MRTVNIFVPLEPSSSDRHYKKEREHTQESSVRVHYPATWTYEQKCVADEERISALRQKK